MAERTSSGTVLRAATFGCVPVSDDANTRAQLNDLCDLLSLVFRLPIRSHRAPSPGALASAFRSGRVSLVWSSPALAAIDSAMREGIPLVRSVRGGTSSYVGVLFVPSDSPIQTPAHLAGTRVAWVDPSSAAGYLFPRLALAERGVDPNGLFASETHFGSHGAVVDAVRSGRADVGATFAVYEDNDPSRALLRAGFGAEPLEVARWRVLLPTASIPSDVIVASRELIDTLALDPVEALVQMHRTPKAAEALRHVLGTDSFERCPLGCLDGLRAQLERAKALAS